MPHPQRQFEDQYALATHDSHMLFGHSVSEPVHGQVVMHKLLEERFFKKHFILLFLIMCMHVGLCVVVLGHQKSETSDALKLELQVMVCH